MAPTPSLRQTQCLQRLAFRRIDDNDRLGAPTPFGPPSTAPVAGHRVSETPPARNQTWRARKQRLRVLSFMVSKGPYQAAATSSIETNAKVWFSSI